MSSESTSIGCPAVQGPSCGEGGPSTSQTSARARQVKLVLLGDQGVGKSSLALRFVRGEFQEHHEATIGAAFLTQTIRAGETTVKMDIWDTAGQERYHSLAPMYYRGAAAAIVVYDINNANTFERALAWVRELRQQTTGSVLIVLAGNKVDLASEHRAVTVDDARSFAEDNGLIFAEVSAKTGLAVNEVFMAIALKVARRGDHGQTTGQNRERVQLDEEDVDTGPVCRC